MASPSGQLWVDSPAEFGTDFELGESISINGICLTVVDVAPLKFDVSPETVARTAADGLRVGARVNLERAMTPQTRFGGHIVQGHVDAVGELVSARPEGNSSVLTFRTPPEGDRYLIDKGSIAIDGVSLTVVEPNRGQFDVWVIPHTLTHTRLGDLKPGSQVNLEYDVIAKHLEKLSASYSAVRT